jgi:hypothetical protein
MKVSLFTQERPGRRENPGVRVPTRTRTGEGADRWAGTLLSRIPEVNQDVPGDLGSRIRASGDQLARRPNPSAMRDTTRVFKLTPSFSALAASLAWRLFGTRWTHFLGR